MNTDPSSNWQPDMQKIGTIIRLIEYIQSTDNAKQKEAFGKFHELKKNEEFSAYCAAIFSQKKLSIDTRRQSGLLLKEALRHNFRKYKDADNDTEIISDSVLSVCKKCLLQCLCEDADGSKFIRDTSAIAITTIVRELHNDGTTNPYSRHSEFDEWPDLIESLLHLLKQHQNDQNPVVIQSILHLIMLLCHDCGQIIRDSSSASQLIEALLVFASSSNTKMREYCLKSLYYLFHWQPAALLSVLDKYIGVLLNVINNNPNTHSSTIMKVVTDTMIVLMNQYWDNLSSNNNRNVVFKIFEFILCGTKHEDNDVCCTAAEFWSLYAMDSSKDSSYLLEYCSVLLPVLVSRCRYTEELLSLIDFENDDQSRADLSEDLAPRFYKTRSERGLDENGEKQDDDANGSGSRPFNMDEEESSWNIRKCAATQLEKLSFAGGDIKKTVLSIVLPMIKGALESSDYLDREAGLLVLGAITQKSYESIIPSLPELIPFILKQCENDKHILVQQIAYWSLARFSNWYYTTNEGDVFYEDILYQFLAGVQANSKRVQRAACGAIATFITSTNEKILRKKQYIEALMNTFLSAFNNYHLKNFPHLIDVILCCTNVIVKNTSSDNQSNILCDPKFQDALLPPIIKRWIALQNDTNIFSLFEAITQWTMFIGHTQHFQTHYLKEIFVTTLNISVELKNECREYAEYEKLLKTKTKETEEEEQTADAASNGHHVAPQNNKEEPDKPNKEFWVCSLDLLAVLVEKCNPSIKHLIWLQKNDYNAFYYQKFLEMLYCTICETHFNVRRNGLALLGDLITYHAPEMKPHLGKFLKIVIANLNWDWQTVCTNASWCIGQALATYSDAAADNNNNNNMMSEYCDDILSHLVEILKCQSSPTYIVTNVAITMARLVTAFPNRIIKKWDKFAVEWIKSLAMFQEDNDKIEAFETLMLVVMKNPIAVVQSKHGCSVLFESIASWKQPPKHLNEQFHKVLLGFRTAAPNWQNIMNRLEPQTRQILKTRYNV